MSNLELARWYAALLGVVLVTGGLAGFVDNPIVGHPDADGPIFNTGAAHNILFIVAGAAGLFVAFGLSGRGLANGLIAFGVGFAILLILTIISPSLFGLFDVEVNLADHVLHSGLALVTAVVGWLAHESRAKLVVTG